VHAKFQTNHLNFLCPKIFEPLRIKHGLGLLRTSPVHDVAKQALNHPTTKKLPMPFQTTNTNAILFLLVFILAFFPNLFFGLLRLPFAVIYPSRTTEPQTPPSCLSSAPDCNIHESTPTATAIPTMSWFQKTITLPSRSRGSYLVTDDIVSALPEIKNYKVGLLNLFVQHTSCAISLNENWDSDVRADMSDALDRIVPEDRKGNLYRHSCEGPDDMVRSRLRWWGTPLATAQSTCCARELTFNSPHMLNLP